MKYLIAVFLFFCTSSTTVAQTVGLFQNTSQSFDGYTIFSAYFGKETYMIDNCGKLVHSWPSDMAGSRNPQHLLEDGTLVRSGSVGNQAFGSSSSGGFEKLDWQGNVVWRYSLSDTNFVAHHDFIVLPSGNILTAVWETRSTSERVNAGRNPANMNGSFWTDKIVELKPIGSDSAVVVWEWDIWDHLVQDFSPAANNFGVVSDHPELIDINLMSNASGSWMHMNSLDYNPALDQIVFSLRNFNEIMIIDHSTTTAEAASHSGGNSGKGGDILFRWGNPANYGRGTTSDRQLFQQHDAKWIKHGVYTGAISIFNNGLGRPAGPHSSVEVVVPPLLPGNLYYLDQVQPFGPPTPSWTYPATGDTGFYSATMGGVTVQPNGTFLICEGGKGKFFEVDSAGNTVWEYISPVTQTGPVSQGSTGNNLGVFKISRYGVDHPGLSSQQLLPGAPIELNPVPYQCVTFPTTSVKDDMHLVSESLVVAPNPTRGFSTLRVNAIQAATWHARFIDVAGRIISQNKVQLKSGLNEFRMDFSGFVPGFYIVEMTSGTKKLHTNIVVE